jgi:hypothetical protein
VSNLVFKLNTMKSKFVAAALIITGIFSGLRSQAQLPHVSLYVHALYASALDKSSQKLYNNGFGGVAGLTFGTKATRFVGSIGYSSFTADKGENLLGNETYIPVKAGVRQNLPLVLSFLYLQGDLGVGFVGNKGNTNNDTRFAFDLGAGAHFGAFEAALVWDNFNEKQPSGWSSWLTIQAGFNIGF